MHVSHWVGKFETVVNLLVMLDICQNSKQRSITLKSTSVGLKKKEKEKND